jgi:hypothetical protein
MKKLGIEVDRESKSVTVNKTIPAIDEVTDLVGKVNDQLNKLGGDNNAGVPPQAAGAVAELKDGFAGQGGVVERLRSIVPIVQRIRAQFARIPTVGSIPAIEGMPDEPPIIPELTQRAARRVLGDIAAAKQTLIDIERGLRPRLRGRLIDLRATLQANNSGNDPASPFANANKQVGDLLKAADDLYLKVYADVRIIERGIASVLLPVNVRMGLRNYQQQIRALDPEDPLTVEATQVPRERRLYRIPFFGEEDAEYEIVVGLSHIPPFQIPSREPEFANKELIKVDLLDDKGSQSAYSDSLRLDTTVSTPTMRVYRLPKMAGRSSQRFQLQVTPNTDYAGVLLNDTVRYTVSIASLRPNVDLHTGIVYETLRPADAAKPEKINETEADRRQPLNTIHGTFNSLLPGPVVEVSVYGGTPILGASVKGLYQVLGKDNALDRFPSIEFRDDGVTPDRVKNDGTYTAQIPVDGTPAGGAAYRLGIQAFATDKQHTQNVAFEPASKEAADRTQENLQQNKKADAGEPQDAPPLHFERATSIHFHVER